MVMDGLSSVSQRHLSCQEHYKENKTLREALVSILLMLIYTCSKKKRSNYLISKLKVCARIILTSALTLHGKTFIVRQSRCSESI
jgi:hypothetical protein